MRIRLPRTKKIAYPVTWFYPGVFFFFICVKGFCQTPANNCSSSAFQQIPVNSTQCNVFTMIPWDCTTTIGTPAIPGCNGVTGAGRDGWGWFTAAAGTTVTNVKYANKNGDAQIYIYSGTCGALTLVACVDDWVLIPEVITFASTPGTNYYVRVVSIQASMQGSICVWSTILPPPCTPVPANDDPCTATTIPVGLACAFVTYTNACSTPTTGVPAPGCGNYVGDDVWFKAIAPASGQIRFDSNTGTVLDGGMAVYDTTGGASCSGGMNLIACDDNSSVNGQMPMLTVSGLNPGEAVYVRVWENGADNNGTFKICAYDPSPCSATLANDDPCGATLLTAGVNCTLAFYTNLCATATPGIPAPSCGNYSGGDVWFKVVVPPSGALFVRTHTGVITDGSVALYSATACNGTFTEVDCDDDSGPGLMGLIMTSGLTPGSMAYIRVWSYNNTNNGTFRLCVSDPCPSGVPVNDLPCNATILPYGVSLPGSTGCATNTNDPAMPSCFTNVGGIAQMHTVWYKFTAVSTCTKIKVYPNTINNTQMAVFNFSGTCNSLGTAIACNDDYQPCGAGGHTYKYPQIHFNSVVGNTYYIMMDGRNGRTGSFSIQLINGGTWPACSNAFPPMAVQDCALPMPVCSYTLSIPNPGFFTIGNICDVPTPAPCTGGTSGCSVCATSCLCTGERGSSWYKIIIGNVVGTQYLEFSIVPNNYPAPYPGGETDYDFAVYGPNPSCANLSTPIRCHYSPLGVTGVFGPAAGQAPPAYSPDYDPAFRERIPVLTGEIYYLNVANYENSKNGFTLNILPTTPLANVVLPGGTLIWTGAVSTDWFNVNNWGGCNIPNCSVNAIIPGFAVNFPIINGAGANCRSLDINFGASLNINAPYELNICGDYNNSGTFTASANSTVLFQDTSANLSTLHDQTVDGLLTGANQFWNVTVKKPAGWKVISNQDIDIGGNLLVSGAAGSGGEFSAAGKYHKAGGNFTIESSPLTAFYTAGTTLQFNGTAQTYLNRGLLNNVLMNQTGAGTLTLQNHGLAGTAWMRVNAASTLTLTNGKIIAGTGPAATNDNRVDILNPAVAAITVGSTASYIEGTLRRSMPSALGSYDFPVGTSAKGYQRINFNFTAALPASNIYWNVYFDNTAPATNPALGNECSSSYHSGGLLALDNGFWNVEAFPPFPTSGIMNVTNFNRNLSWGVPLGAGWTVMYNNSNSNLATDWQLNPFPAFPCVNPPVTAVLRNNMIVTSLFTGNPVWIGTAQSQTPLPVDLLSFEARALKNSIELSWATASEKNNKGFDVERTITPPYKFEKMAWLEGHGTTTSTHYYDFEDKSVKEGIDYYYRLKQTDYNGNFAYSKVVAASIRRIPFTFVVEPNPYSGFTNIMFDLKEAGRVHLSIYNDIGQKVATLVNGMESTGIHNYDFSAGALGYAPGIYSVLLQINDEVYTKRIIETE
ncbi:MAG TPA: hypothetical protein VJY62_10090 [Bacteroidia bacterium]|nr:hypothetical protein [Bacteroidia bacterium]